MRLAICLLLALTATAASAQTYVKPHVNKNGQYTEGHYRSAPNSTTYDNYGTRGNYNPYTGNVGTQTPREERTPQCGYSASGKYVCR